MNHKGSILYFLLILVSLVPGCRQDGFGTKPAELAFSTDTVTFDTIFTTIGSATLNFKVYNRGDKTLRIHSITLGGGEQSFFRLNIDGQPASEVSNIDIPRKDSLYIFVAVTVDPLNSDNPLVVKDSILFDTEDELQNVKLIAYGQDVNLINGEILETQTWTNQKPYLIYNSVAVDTGCTLTVQEGTRIYLHRNSSMVVWGTLRVNGTAEHPVIFRNDRLEHDYDVIAGQWGTIYFDPISQGNIIQHALIQNSIAGIQIGFPTESQVPDLILANSILQNVSFAGIYAFGANITCYNTIIADCAGPAAALLRGGSYRFLHCTVSNKGVLGASRSSPSIVLSNQFYNPETDEQTGETQYVKVVGDLQEASFLNCILYGNMEHEFQLVDNSSNLFVYRFDHCLMKASRDSFDLTDNTHFNEVILNKSPRFANDSDRYHLNFNLDTLSPAIDAGDPALIGLYPFLSTDMSGYSRLTDGKPDLGALERKEE